MRTAVPLLVIGLLCWIAPSISLAQEGEGEGGATGEHPPLHVEHFGAMEDQVGGRRIGMVTSHGMPLFMIRASSGDYSAPERARIIAERLNKRWREEMLTPEMLLIERMKGQMCIVHRMPGRMSDLLVTVDRSTAAPFRVSPDVLASWWLVLLKDNVSLALGQYPTATGETPCGVAFAAVYEVAHQRTEAGRKIEARTLHEAVSGLSAVMRDHLMHAAERVPPDFIKRISGSSRGSQR